MKKNNYSSLKFYNSIEEYKPITKEEKDRKIKEKFGAFSISAALKNPQIVNPNFIQYTGVT
jgi:hypothetical protein